MKKIILHARWPWTRGLHGELRTKCPLPPGQYVAWADHFLADPFNWVVRVENGDWARAERALGVHDFPWMPIVRFEVTED